MDGQTDGQTDGQMTCDSKTALDLHCSASRGKNEGGWFTTQ